MNFGYLLTVWLAFSLLMFSFHKQKLLILISYSLLIVSFRVSTCVLFKISAGWNVTKVFCFFWKLDCLTLVLRSVVHLELVFVFSVRQVLRFVWMSGWHSTCLTRMLSPCTAVSLVSSRSGDYAWGSVSGFCLLKKNLFAILLVRLSILR